jgi:REP element-mobilizing transposase RayT
MQTTPPPPSVPERDPLNRAFFLPRLPAQAYQGKAIVHWTLTIQDKQTGWLTNEVHLRLCEVLLHTLSRGHLICPSYVLMPDHMHFIWMGCDDACDQRTSMAFFRTHAESLLAPARFQHQPHDRVLRANEKRGEAFEGVVNYILENPIRARLVDDLAQWKYFGSMVPGYPQMHPVDASFWQRFWRVYFKLAWKEDIP